MKLFIITFSDSYGNRWEHYFDARTEAEATDKAREYADDNLIDIESVYAF